MTKSDDTINRAVTLLHRRLKTWTVSHRRRVTVSAGLFLTCCRAMGLTDAQSIRIIEDLANSNTKPETATDGE